jgi:hypothetical protein
LIVQILQLSQEIPENGMAMPKPTNVPTNKTLAATGGSALGSGLAVIIVYVH